jgi:glycerophosphoryl diester phosphodiesterase
VNYRSRPGPLAIAHRGGAGLAAENTLEAFVRSYALGVRYLETDIRCTRDGELVAFHDARLNRVTTAAGPLRGRSTDELRHLRVLGGGSILALRALVEAFPRACFTLDVKHAEVIEPLGKLLTGSDLAGRVCVAGARGRWLRELQARVGPRLCTALSWRDLAHLASRRRGRYGDAAFAHIPLRLGRIPVFRDDLLARAHDAGLRAIVWTVNDAPTMHRLLDHSVDGIITDRPDLLREVLIARGQWHTPVSFDAPLSDAVS